MLRCGANCISPDRDSVPSPLAVVTVLSLSLVHHSAIWRQGYRPAAVWPPQHWHPGTLASLITDTSVGSAAACRHWQCDGSTRCPTRCSPRWPIACRRPSPLPSLTRRQTLTSPSSRGGRPSTRPGRRHATRNPLPRAEPRVHQLDCPVRVPVYQCSRREYGGRDARCVELEPASSRREGEERRRERAR